MLKRPSKREKKMLIQTSMQDLYYKLKNSNDVSRRTINCKLPILLIYSEFLYCKRIFLLMLKVCNIIPKYNSMISLDFAELVLLIIFWSSKCASNCIVFDSYFEPGISCRRNSKYYCTLNILKLKEITEVELDAYQRIWFLLHLSFVYRHTGKKSFTVQSNLINMDLKGNKKFCSS